MYYSKGMRELLTQRQLNIIEDLIREEKRYLPSKYFAQKYAISIRTVQTELSNIREAIQKYHFIEFMSVPSKGTRMAVCDEEAWAVFLQKEKQSLKEFGDLNSRNERIHRIIAILVSTKRTLSVSHLADRLFISKSTLLADLKEVSTIFARYDLAIINKINYGLYVEGSEVNIRTCIINEEINFFDVYNGIMEYGQISDNIAKIRDIVVSVLTEYQYSVSDVALQNLIVHIDIIIRRIREGFKLEEIEAAGLKEELKLELAMAQDIFSACKRYFGTEQIKAEIMRLAIYLHGKSDYADSSYITREIDEFVLASLNSIKKNFGIDFSDNTQLRIALSLHLVPLITRLRYSMQLRNELLHDVRRSFPIAFDIASSFCYQIQEYFGYSLNEDEIAYFAIYFNSALNEYQDNLGMSNILIVSALKRSETLLLRERLNSWFSYQLANLDIMNLYDLPDDLSFYDVIATTEKNELYHAKQAYLISKFPSEEDYRTIKIALDGFKSKEDILSLFNESMTFIGKAGNKDEIIRCLCHFIEECEPGNELCDEVLKREAMGGTFYGNHVAMPHPIHPVTKKTYISVALLENEVIWDKVNSARIIFLLSMEKDNPKAFSIWSYLSDFMTNTLLIQSILKDLSYQNLVKQISYALDHMSWDLRDY